MIPVHDLFESHQTPSTQCRTAKSDHAVSFAAPRFCVQGMLNCSPFGASAMNASGLGTDRLRLKLRIMSDDDLWWLFVSHWEECSHEFWEELETRKAAGTLSKGSPFWAMSKPARCRQPAIPT
jgi:hypothetical protein